MFTGKFEHAIDEKGRLTIPARYRELLRGGGTIFLGFDRNLIVLTDAAFQNVADSIRMTSLTDEDARALKRWIFSNSSPLEIDKAGRILIPQHLRADAGIGNSVVIIGSGDYFEIFSPDTWQKQREEQQNPNAVSKRFSAFNIPL